MAPVNLTNGTRVTLNTATIFLIITIDTLIFVLSITGNSLVIAVVVKNVNMRTTMNLFIVNIAASDLLTTVLPFPVQMATFIVGRWPFHQNSTAGLVLCKMAHASWILSSGVSILSLVAIALDRFWAVFFPTKRPLSTRRPFVTLTVIWFLCIAFAFPFLIVTGIYEKEGTTICWAEENAFDMILLLLLFSLQIYLATTAILVLYPAILIRLWKRKLPGNPSTANQEIRDRTNRKVTCMAVTLMIAFVVSWFPFLGVSMKNFIERDNVEQISASIVYLISSVLTYTSCTWNPLLCLTLNSNFRKGFKVVQRLLYNW